MHGIERSGCAGARAHYPRAQAVGGIGVRVGACVWCVVSECKSVTRESHMEMRGSAPTGTRIGE
jgi:hypothetical protein